MLTRNQVLRILAEHRPELQQQFGLKSLALFGSAARDEMTETSDVDLLVEIDRPITLFGLVALQQQLERLLNVDRVDLVLRDTIFPPLKENILAGAIHVI